MLKTADRKTGGFFFFPSENTKKSQRRINEPSTKEQRTFNKESPGIFSPLSAGFESPERNRNFMIF
jgi:hypothetical protein